MPLLNIPVEFLLFALTLLEVAVLHTRNFEVAVTGLLAITLYKGLAARDMDLIAHFLHEERLVLNLLGLLLGFAILARHFELSRVPDWLPRFLPDDWKGGFVLLVLVAVISSFLDNIAAAIIGGVVAGTSTSTGSASATWRESSPPATPVAPARWSATPPRP